MTAKQTRIIDWIKANGYIVRKVEKMEYSDRVWIEAERLHFCPLYPGPCAGHPLLNENLYGTIGPRGKLGLRYTSGTYTDDKVTEPWNLRMRLEKNGTVNDLR